MTDRTYPLHVPTEAEVNDLYGGNTNVEPMIALLNYYHELCTSQGWVTDDIEDHVCDMLVYRIMQRTDIVEGDDWTRQTISDALEMPGDYADSVLIDYITDAACWAFGDHGCAFHAAHIRDALRDNFDNAFNWG